MPLSPLKELERKKFAWETRERRVHDKEKHTPPPGIQTECVGQRSYGVVRLFASLSQREPRQPPEKAGYVNIEWGVEEPAQDPLNPSCEISLTPYSYINTPIRIESR